MIIPIGNNHYVEITDTPQAGAAWVVRLYRKTFIFKKVITSDWFLDREQAKEFAEDLARELRTRESLNHVKNRAPGWTFHRPTT